MSVVEKVTGFKKIKFHTHENAGYGEIRLPDIQMHTTSFWWTVPARVCLDIDADGVPLGRAAAIEGLRGILRALETVATIALMCDPRDIGQTLEDAALGDITEDVIGSRTSNRNGAETGFDPSLYLFDNVPGGIGLAARIHEQAPELFARARLLIRRCACPQGCPLCVGVSGGFEASPMKPSAAPTHMTRKRSAELLFERLIIDA